MSIWGIAKSANISTVNKESILSEYLERVQELRSELTQRLNEAEKGFNARREALAGEREEYDLEIQRLPKLLNKALEARDTDTARELQTKKIYEPVDRHEFHVAGLELELERRRVLSSLHREYHNKILAELQAAEADYNSIVIPAQEDLNSLRYAFNQIKLKVDQAQVSEKVVTKTRDEAVIQRESILQNLKIE